MASLRSAVHGLNPMSSLLRAQTQGSYLAGPACSSVQTPAAAHGDMASLRSAVHGLNPMSSLLRAQTQGSYLAGPACSSVQTPAAAHEPSAYAVRAAWLRAAHETEY